MRRAVLNTSSSAIYFLSLGALVVRFEPEVLFKFSLTFSNFFATMDLNPAHISFTGGKNEEVERVSSYIC